MNMPWRNVARMSGILNDEQVLALAKKYNLLMSAGSDAHRTEDIAGAAVLSPYDIQTVDRYLELLKSGEAKLMKNGEII